MVGAEQGALLGFGGPVVSSVAVILGLAVAAWCFARRVKLGAANGARGSADKRITVVASLPIGLGGILMIVEADGQRFLVGAGRQGLVGLGAVGQAVPMERVG